MQDFAAYVSQDQYRPQQKFIALILPGLLAARSVLLSEVGEQFQGKTISQRGETAYDTAQHRFGRNLASKRLNLREIETRYHERVAPILQRNGGEGVNVAVDETDFAKPHARPHRKRGMQGASKVRDGSKSTSEAVKVGMGYPCLTVEASVPGGNVIPLASHAYSRALPDPVAQRPYRSELVTHLEVIGRAATHVGPRAWWSFDRGYSGQGHLDGFDALSLRWIVRMPVSGPTGARALTVDNGLEIGLRSFAEALSTPFRVAIENGEYMRVGLAHVRLGKGRLVGSRVRTLLVGWLPSARVPFVLLAGEPLPIEQATADLIRREYRRRWSVETSHRLSKDTHGWGSALEGFHVCKWVSIQRLVFFAMLVAGFGALERDCPSTTTRKALDRMGKVRQPPDDPRGRLRRILGGEMRRQLPSLWERLSPKRKKRPTRPPLTEAMLLRQRRNAENAVNRANRSLERLKQTQNTGAG